jgi:hypothetical protein
MRPWAFHYWYKSCLSSSDFSLEIQVWCPPEKYRFPETAERFKNWRSESQQRERKRGSNFYSWPPILKRAGSTDPPTPESKPLQFSQRRGTVQDRESDSIERYQQIVNIYFNGAKVTPLVPSHQWNLDNRPLRNPVVKIVAKYHMKVWGTYSSINSRKSTFSYSLFLNWTPNCFAAWIRCLAREYTVDISTWLSS